MSGISDGGQNPPEREPREAGLSILDFEALPHSHRKIMRVVLRRSQASYDDLRKILEALPEGERLDQNELDGALATLVQQQYLLQLDDQHGAVYRVNHRRQALSRKRSNLWDAIESSSRPSRRSPKPDDRAESS